jgi:hypothetical protein
MLRRRAHASGRPGARATRTGSLTGGDKAVASIDECSMSREGQQPAGYPVGVAVRFAKAW